MWRFVKLSVEYNDLSTPHACARQRYVSATVHSPQLCSNLKKRSREALTARNAQNFHRRFAAVFRRFAAVFPAASRRFFAAVFRRFAAVAPANKL